MSESNFCKKMILITCSLDEKVPGYSTLFLSITELFGFFYADHYDFCGAI